MKGLIRLLTEGTSLVSDMLIWLNKSTHLYFAGDAIKEPDPPTGYALPRFIFHSSGLLPVVFD